MVGPVLLDAVATANDPLALIIAAGASVISVLLGIVIAMVASRAGRLETRVDSNEESQRKAYVEMVQFKERVKALEGIITEWKVDRLTIRDFNSRMDPQDKWLEKIDAEVDQLKIGLAKRPTTSQLMPSAALYRQEERRDERRDDTDPPPVRPKLPSRR